MKKDEHITVTPEVFQKLKEICESEHRTKRGEVTKMIEEKHKKLFGRK